MLTDIETRKLIAEERRAALVRAAATSPRPQRTRLWLADHLIAAGERLRPDCAAPSHRPLGAS